MIRMVKKILLNGEPCRKCMEVEKRLQEDGLLEQIDQVLLADERDPESAGMRLARQHQIQHAPFFIVEQDKQAVQIYTSYLKFVREVLHKDTEPTEVAQELLETQQNLDLL